MSNYKDMTTEELNTMLSEIKAELEARAKAGVQSFKYEFDATNDPRKGVPYVAKLYIDSNSKLQRRFFNLDKSNGKNSVTVSGTYEAKAGDIIEMRTGGSWKNDYRYCYLIEADGSQTEIGDSTNSADMAKIKKMLKSE